MRKARPPAQTVSPSTSSRTSSATSCSAANALPASRQGEDCADLARPARAWASAPLVACRMHRQPRHPLNESPPAEPLRSAARHRQTLNHIWHVDLTTVRHRAASELPGFPSRAAVLAVLLVAGHSDHYSRASWASRSSTSRPRRRAAELWAKSSPRPARHRGISSASRQPVHQRSVHGWCQRARHSPDSASANTEASPS